MHVYHEPDTQQLYTLREGSAGIIQTVRLMRDLVEEYKLNPQIRRLAMYLVGDLPQKDELGEVDRIFRFVRDDIRYLKDIYDVETLATPVKTLDFRQGDCDDKATLLAALLESIGYETAFKIVGYRGNDYEHVYVYVTGNKVFGHLDPTEPEDMGWEAPGVTKFLYVQ